MQPIVFIPLSRGKIAVIDFDDMDRIGRVKWCAFCVGKKQKAWYAIRSVYRPSTDSWKTTFMHNAVIGAIGVDHKNGDGLDNRKENLRPATHSQNMHGFIRKRLNTTSRFRGVSKTKYGNWIAHIRKPNPSVGRSIRVHLGCFLDEEEAARTYDRAAIQFGYYPEALNFKPT